MFLFTMQGSTDAPADHPLHQMGSESRSSGSTMSSAGLLTPLGDPIQSPGTQPCGSSTGGSNTPVATSSSQGRPLVPPLNLAKLDAVPQGAAPVPSRVDPLGFGTANGLEEAATHRPKGYQQPSASSCAAWPYNSAATHRACSKPAALSNPGVAGSTPAPLQHPLTASNKQTLPAPRSRSHPPSLRPSTPLSGILQSLAIPLGWEQSSRPDSEGPRAWRP